MKNFSLVLVTIMFLFLIAVAAHGAPASASTVPTAPVVSAIEKALLSRTAKAEADIEILFGKAKANPSAENLKAYADCRKADIADRDKINKDLRGRIDQLKKADKADKKVVARLAEDVAELKGMQQKDRDALVSFVGRLGDVEGKVAAVEQRTTSLENRATGIELRQNATDDNVVRIERKVDAVVATQWQSQLRLGVETGRDIATSSTNAVVGFSSTLQSGYGWYSALSLGLGDVLVAPHPTSAAFRAGVTSTIGSANSPLSAQFGLLVGVAAKESLALDAGVAVGANVGLTYKPRGWPVGFTASAGQVFGRFEGFVVHAGAFFDPLSLGDLGK